MTNNTQKKDKCIENSEDRRVRRTEYAIKMAFLNLIQQKKLDKISVSELAAAADVNRKTFYNHYQDIYQVLGEIEDDFATMVISFLDQSHTYHDIADPYPFFYQLTQEIQNNADLYQLFIETGEHVRLSKKIKAKLKIHLNQENQHLIHLDQETFDFLIDFLLAGVMSAYEQWFLNQQTMTAQQLAQQIAQITIGAAQALAKKNS